MKLLKNSNHYYYEEGDDISNNEIPKANEIILKYNMHTELKEKDVRKLKRDNENNGSVKLWLWHSKKIVMTLILILLCTTGGMSCAFSPTMQNQLANRLHLDEENISIINKSVSDNGITMSIVSSHVAKNTAVIMLAFTKDSGETFGNSLNPDIEKKDIVILVE